MRKSRVRLSPGLRYTTFFLLSEDPNPVKAGFNVAPLFDFSNGGRISWKKQAGSSVRLGFCQSGLNSASNSMLAPYRVPGVDVTMGVSTVYSCISFSRVSQL